MTESTRRELFGNWEVVAKLFGGFLTTVDGVKGVVATVSFVKIDEKTDTICFGMPLNGEDAEGKFVIYTAITAKLNEVVKAGHRVFVSDAKMEYVANNAHFIIDPTDPKKERKLYRVDIKMKANAYKTAASEGPVVLATDSF